MGGTADRLACRQRSKAAERSASPSDWDFGASPTQAARRAALFLHVCVLAVRGIPFGRRGTQRPGPTASEGWAPLERGGFAVRSLGRKDLTSLAREHLPKRQVLYAKLLYLRTMGR